MITAEDESTAAAELAVLSPREREVLVLLAKGFTMKEVAGRLDITYQTVMHHHKGIVTKLKVTRIEAAVLAAKARWV